MAVNRDSANWRLLGGGGLLLGGTMWLAGALLFLASVTAVGSWLGIIGVLVVGAALFIVAFGPAGSDGAVGAWAAGKGYLVALGAGYVLLAIALLLPGIGVAGFVIAIIAALLIIVGGVLSALAIYRHGVARGAARWILFVPAVLGIVYAVTTLLGLANAGLLPFLVLGAGFAVTGLLYLLNRNDLG